MAVPWLYGLGFVITFSALFAKIHRVRLIHRAGMQMQRKQVTLADVIPVMAIMLAIEVAILLSWQMVAPLKWEREIIEEIDGFAIVSVGSCEGGETGWRFYAGLVIFHVLCLFYALVLCFQTKDINSDFAESSFVSLAVVFMFQVLVLTVPISALVRENTDVLYFVQAAAVFLQNFTVLFLIFVPKMLRMSEEQRNPSNRNLRTTSLQRQPRQSGSNPNGRGLSWTGASLTDMGDEPPSRHMRYSDDELSAIREEEGRKSSNTTSERAPVMSRESSSSVRRSVKFSSVEKSDDASVSSEFEPVNKKQGDQLSPDELESEWEKLGFPSKGKAQMMFDLLLRSTDPERRRTILKDLIDDSPTEYSVVPAPDPEILIPGGTRPLEKTRDPVELAGAVGLQESGAQDVITATTTGEGLSSRPMNISPRAISDHLKSGLSDLGDDSSEKSAERTSGEGEIA